VGAGEDADPCRGVCEDLIQDVGQDAVSVVVIDFRRGIGADFWRDFDFCALGFAGGEGRGLDGKDWFASDVSLQYFSRAFLLRSVD